MHTKWKPLCCFIVMTIILSFGIATPGANAKEPIVFGLIDAMSGPFKSVGDEIVSYATYAVEGINAKGGILGQKVKLNLYDHQMKPGIGARVAKKAILQDGVKVLFVHTNSGVALAVSKVAKKHNVILVVIHTEADQITGSAFSPNTFRVGLSTAMHSGLLAQHFAQTPYKRFYILCQDYAFGHAVADAFKKVFNQAKRPDQTIVGEEYHPLGTKDFGPYVTKALASKPEVVITGNFGPDLFNLVNQSRALGLKSVLGSYYLDANYSHIMKGNMYPAVLAEAYIATVQTKRNQAFVPAYQAWLKKYNPKAMPKDLVPSSVAITINGFEFAAAAIEKAGSVDAAKVIAAWEGMSFEGLAGKLTMRACDHQAQFNGYIGVFEKDHPFKDIIPYPLSGEAIMIPIEKISVPPAETGNPRCR